MRAIGMILKLALVALLACLVFSRPPLARADGTEYACNSNWSQDEQGLDVWMSNCMICTHQGGPPNYQVCYTLTYAAQKIGYTYDENGNNRQSYTYYVPSSYQTCNQINQSVESCVESCSYQYNQQWQQLFQQDCTPIG